MIVKLIGVVFFGGYLEAEWLVGYFNKDILDKKDAEAHEEETLQTHFYGILYKILNIKLKFVIHQFF